MNHERERAMADTPIDGCSYKPALTREQLMFHSGKLHGAAEVLATIENVPKGLVALVENGGDGLEFAGDRVQELTDTLHNMESFMQEPVGQEKERGLMNVPKYRRCSPMLTDYVTTLERERSRNNEYRHVTSRLHVNVKASIKILEKKQMSAEDKKTLLAELKEILSTMELATA